MTEAGVPLGDRWRLWDQFALRGPGFPASGVLRLAPEGLAVAADRFVGVEVLSGADWEAFEEVFGAAVVSLAGVLQGIAGSGLFRSAVAWQNRAVLRSGVGPFLSWVPSVAGRTSMPRQREELVAHYWQRFCVKNDTIGFSVRWVGVGGICRVGVWWWMRVWGWWRVRRCFSPWAVDAVARVVGGGGGARSGWRRVGCRLCG